jgi:hypothetical protein
VNRDCWHHFLEGAFAKISGKEGVRFTRPAIVFESEEKALEAVLNGAVKKGHVIVIRSEGPIGFNEDDFEGAAQTAHTEFGGATPETVCCLMWADYLVSAWFGFFRPFGTWLACPRIGVPALKRWAILARPFGTETLASKAG